MKDSVRKISTTALGGVVRLVAITLLALLFSAGATFAQVKAYVASTGNTSVLKLDTATNTATATITGTGSRHLSFSRNGAFLYSVSFNAIQVIDTATNTLVANIPTGFNPINVVESSNGFLYVCNNASGTVSIIDTATYTVASTLSPLFCSSVAVTPDGSRSGCRSMTPPPYSPPSRSLTRRRTRSRRPSPRLRPGEFRFLDRVHAGRRLRVRGGFSRQPGFGDRHRDPCDGRHRAGGVVSDLRRRHARRGFRLRGEPHGEQRLGHRHGDERRGGDRAGGSVPRAIAFTPDGASAYVTNGNGDSISVIDTATQTVTSTFPFGSRPWGIAITRLPTSRPSSLPIMRASRSTKARPRPIPAR